MNTQNDYLRLTIRIPPELNDALKKLAASSERSLNSEIVSRLYNTIKLEQTNFATPQDSIKAAAEKIALIAKQIALSLNDADLTSSSTVSLTKTELTKLLSNEEQQLLNWFSKINDKKKSLILSSLPELSCLLIKMLNSNR